MNQLFGNNDFKDFMFKRYTDNSSPKKSVKFRKINKHLDQKISEKIDEASLPIQNLQELSACKFAPQISTLKVSIFVNGNNDEIGALRFAAVEYFKNIQAVNISLIDTMQFGPQIKNLCIPESLHFRGVKFTNKSNVQKLTIEGNNNDVNLNIQNSTFNRICIWIQRFTNVEIQKCQFLNTPLRYFWGFCCYECNSLITEQMLLGNSGLGVGIKNVQNAIMNDMQILDVNGYGSWLWSVPSFEMNNALIQNRTGGIRFQNSVGEIRNSIIRNKVQLIQSRIYYSNFQYEDGNLQEDEESILARLN